eukprot:CAMPEP_0167759876 /NCGR_PEP_ID=MMETSP0110_2-20121227/11267_1 /TAXON_ID=629695 /ORGANISM="Gymnochlora sp., Strain CCMP2014" /LENGTH=267 /DNA_ID=CAMNT_0007646311 /DNA_START=117 /DNA_END=920 /DNA_ORIENTATION=+
MAVEAMRRSRSSLKDVDPKIVRLLDRAEELKLEDEDIDPLEEKLDDEDSAIAVQMGAKSLDLASPVQKQYSLKVRKKLEDIKKTRRENENNNSPGWENFQTGKALFESGRYERALEYLTKAMKEQDPFTRVGGEIQVFLAFTLDAMGRTKDACEILKIIEETHPSRRIAKQAGEFRFVLEAPKLKEDQGKDLNWRFTQNADRYKPRNKRVRAPTKAKYKETSKVSPITEEDPNRLADATFPAWLQNPVVLVMFTAGSIIANYYILKN